MIAIENAFFARDAQVIAKDLLGKVLKVRYKNQFLYMQIIETEAYYLDDKGSHASLGFTQKRKALFMQPGTIYMYYARGNDSLNFSCQGEGNAVLIKSGFPFLDHPDSQSMVNTMQTLNPHPSIAPRPLEKLCNGQTLLCRSLNLKVPDWDQQQLTPGLFELLANDYKPSSIIQTTRLGIPTGRDEHLPYRFIDAAYAKHCTKAPPKKCWMNT